MRLGWLLMIGLSGCLFDTALYRAQQNADVTDVSVDTDTDTDADGDTDTSDTDPPVDLFGDDPVFDWQETFTDPNPAIPIQIGLLWEFCPDSTVFHGQLRDENVVVCRVSAGSVVPEDLTDRPLSLRGNVVTWASNEWWLDIREEEAREVVTVFIDEVENVGCKAVVFDITYAYAYSASVTGFDITEKHQLDYNTWLIGEARSRGLMVGVQATDYADEVESLADEMALLADFALVRACDTLCAQWDPFVSAGKPVLHVEHPAVWPEEPTASDPLCTLAPTFDTILKPDDLGADWFDCSK